MNHEVAHRRFRSTFCSNYTLRITLLLGSKALPEGRDRDFAIASLQEARSWANTAIATASPKPL